MADQREAIDDSISKLLKKLDGEHYNPSGQEDLARAVLNLAEARAWLNSSAQPHGGNAAASK